MTEQQQTSGRANAIIAPLAEIRLQNFKSVTDATVELRPLTVVVGRNSSGKSTLLQSVLALAQAVRSKSNSSQFPLNGEYVRLGTFDEVLSFQNNSESPEISVGFSVAADLGSRRFRPGFKARDGEQASLISWTGHLTAPDLSSNGFATLSAFEFGIATRNEDSARSQVSLDISAVGGEIDRSGPWPLAIEHRTFRRDRSLLRVDGRIVDLISGKSSRVDSIIVAGGLPTAAFKQESRFVVYARHWWNAYNNTLKEGIKEEQRKVGEKVSEGKTVKPSPAAIGFAFDDFLEAYRFELDPFGTSNDDDQRTSFLAAIGHVQEFFEQRSIHNLTRKQSASVALSIATLGEAEFSKRLRKKLAAQEWIDQLVQEDIGVEIGGDLWSATINAASLFRDLQYLGPLRESPQVLYNPGPSRIDLGTKGEYMAAILHAQKDLVIQAPVPGGHVRQMRLGEALNLWLVRLELADKATATDRGRLGIGLTVSPVGTGRAVDLTSVGVGVSQVLPVLLICLLARERSVVLMEQPELHLHPATQVHLADFLIACAQSGRQILIETHSEHLVNRLRLRVAEDETNETGDLVKLLFAEQEDGVTTYRTSGINPLGGLDEDWPSGFLDVGSKEAGELLRQTVHRQRQFSAKKS